MEDGFNYQTAIEEFQDERPVWKQIWAAIITEFTPDKKNWFGAAFSFVLALILTIIIARSEETVSLAGKICGILLDVEIALFGCVFAVYSILLAFLSDEYVKKLLEIDYYRQTNYLRKSTNNRRQYIQIPQILHSYPRLGYRFENLLVILPLPQVCFDCCYRSLSRYFCLTPSFDISEVSPDIPRIIELELLFSFSLFIFLQFSV